MKEYCIDLEIAEELKENGFQQGTYFAYCGYEGILSYPEYFRWNKEYGRISAPTSDEILKELPKTIEEEGLLFGIDIYEDNDMWEVVYWNHT